MTYPTRTRVKNFTCWQDMIFGIREELGKVLKSTFILSVSWVRGLEFHCISCAAASRLSSSIVQLPRDVTMAGDGKWLVDKMFRCQPNTFKYTIGMMGVFRKQGIDGIGFGISSWWVNS